MITIFCRQNGVIYVDQKVSDKLVGMGEENQKKMWQLCENYTGLNTA